MEKLKLTLQTGSTWEKHRRQQELRKETESMLDKERVERIQGDGATVRAREIAVTTLSTKLSEKSYLQKRRQL